MQVLGTLLPPPPRRGQTAPRLRRSQRPAATSLTGQQEIVILAVTAQQAEVIKFAQMDGSIILVLRSRGGLRRRERQPDRPRRRPARPASSSRPSSTAATASIRRSSSRPSFRPRSSRNQPTQSRSPRDRAPRRRDGRDGPSGPAPVRLSGDRHPTIADTRPGREPTDQMADQIRVLIVDDIPETRDHLTKLLGFESDIEVVGAAASGARGARAGRPALARRRPDGHQHAGHGRHRRHRAALGAEVPTAAVVMMSVQGEADYLRRSMLAGAREFLVKPFSSDELTASIRQVYTREREKQSRIERPRRPCCRQPTAPRRRRQRRRHTTARSSRSSARRAASAGRRSRSTWRSPRRPSSASRVVLVDALVPVRRRRRPAQPQPEEQVDRRPGPGARSRRARSRSTRS